MVMDRPRPPRSSSPLPASPSYDEPGEDRYRDPDHVAPRGGARRDPGVTADLAREQDVPVLVDRPALVGVGDSGVGFVSLERIEVVVGLGRCSEALPFGWGDPAITGLDAHAILRHVGRSRS